MNDISGSKMFRLLSYGHRHIGIASCTSDSINAEEVSGFFSTLTISSLARQALGQSKQRFLTLFRHENFSEPSYSQYDNKRDRKRSTALAMTQPMFTASAILWAILYSGATTLLLVPYAFAQTPPPLGSSCQQQDLHKLGINRWVQEEGPWCWATTAGMVMDFHKKTYAPCFIVAAILKENGTIPSNADCCLDTNMPSLESGCIEGGKVSQALSSFGFHLKKRWLSNERAPLSFENVSEELCNERPFISLIKGTGTLNHTVVVYGYAIDPSGTPQVYVHDPQDNSSKPWIVPYDVFFESDDYHHLLDYLSICDSEKTNCPPH